MKLEHLSYGLNVVLIVLLIIGATFAINRVSDVTNDYNTLTAFMEAEKNQLIASNDLVVHEIKTINQNLVTSDQKIKELSEELEKYKSIDSYTKAELLTEIKGMTIEYVPDGTVVENVLVPDTGCVPIEFVNKHFIHVPKKVSFSDQWMSFDATVNKKSLTLDSLSMINKFDVTIGKRVVGKKFLIFNKKENVVDLKSYNPYTSVPYVNNLTVEKEKGSGLKKVLTYTLFFAAGMGVNQIRK